MTHVQGEQRKRRGRIPEFTSIEEEAEFWDTHDTTDYEDEFNAIEVRFAANLSRPIGSSLSEGITIRLDKETLAKLRAEAHQKGIGPTTLARMWILERLNAK